MSPVAESVRREALIADIKLANNGYLQLKYMSYADREYAQQLAKLGKVVITNGLVHIPSTKPEFFPTPYPTKAFKPTHDGPDYEGAILMQQANAGHYD